ncbi:hypothetical protein [uncultured Lactobacillus sp.]|uniref:hypothetical protein n=1 Tax=uncultured Lactobacillus sp. TaxID=153152 RepID=UPI00261E064C|nr:hypothetical protein [uncultured Lactobacillus sp.]
MQLILNILKKLLILVWSAIELIWLCLILPTFRLVWGFTTTDKGVDKRIKKSFKGENVIEIHYSKSESRIKKYIDNNLLQGMILVLDGGSRYRITQSENRYYPTLRGKALHWDQCVRYIKYEPYL